MTSLRTPTPTRKSVVDGAPAMAERVRHEVRDEEPVEIPEEETDASRRKKKRSE